jgi:Domain of unknown function (DUF4118)
MRRYLSRDRVALVAAVVAPLAVCVVLVPFRTSFSNTNVAILLVVVITAVAANGHRVAGALAALSAAMWFEFFFTQPYEHFNITRSADIQTAVLLLAVGLAVSQLAARARRLRVVAITDARYLARVHDTAVLAQSATSAYAVVDHVRQQLADLLNLRGCRFEYGKLLGHPPRLEQDGTVMWGRFRWDVDRLGMPHDDIELRATANGHYYGRFMLQTVPDRVPPLEARLVAVTLADQAAAALDAASSTQENGITEAAVRRPEP